MQGVSLDGGTHHQAAADKTRFQDTPHVRGAVGRAAEEEEELGGEGDVAFPAARNHVKEQPKKASAICNQNIRRMRLEQR